MEQEPGPRGSPQLPQGPAARRGAGAPGADIANTDSLGASFLPAHLGQAAFCEPKTSASNSWWHSLQAYS